MNKSINIALVLGFIFGVWNLLSCAQQGSISGGDKDILPPTFISSYPDTLALNVSREIREIQIDFDELLLLKEHNKQVVISPPLKKNAIFSPQGTPKKYIRVGLSEKLDSATTYSIQFGSAIQDFNENNPLKGFKYVFSTGDFLDSLKVKGKIRDFENRKLPENILVALYKADSTYSDTLVEKSKPYYIAKLDSTKSFTLNYLKPGKYRLVAFNDEVANLRLDRAKERIGFVNRVLDLKEDINQDIQLFSNTLPYRAKSAEQVGYGQFKFIFEGKPEAVDIKSIEEDLSTKKFYTKKYSDSIALWFNPRIDSLSGSKSTRLNFLVRNGENIDTLKAVYRQEEIGKLVLNPNSTRGSTPYDTLVLKSNYPIKAFNADFVTVKKDSTLVDFSYKRSSDFEHALMFPKKWGDRFEIEALPGAFEDIFEQKNDSLRFRLQIGSEKQFGNLEITLQNTPKTPFLIQLLDNKDEVINERYTSENKLNWKGLSPGKYYLRLYVDENKNGFWDTGDFFARKQPEAVYLYPTNIEIKAFWDVEETWILK